MRYLTTCCCNSFSLAFAFAFDRRFANHHPLNPCFICLRLYPDTRVINEPFTQDIDSDR